MVYCWEQEILGYHFIIVHRSNKMMVDVDALNWQFGCLIIHHIAIAALFSYRNQYNRPRSYANTQFSNLGNVKIIETDNPSSNPPSFLTSNILHHVSQDNTTHSSKASSLNPSSLPFITTLPIQMLPSTNHYKIYLLHDSVTQNIAMAALQIPQSLEFKCLCINDVIGSYTNWGHLHGNGPISWSLQNLFTYPTLSSLFNLLHP